MRRSMRSRRMPRRAFDAPIRGRLDRVSWRHVDDPLLAAAGGEEHPRKRYTGDLAVRHRGVRGRRRLLADLRACESGYTAGRVELGYAVFGDGDPRAQTPPWLRRTLQITP